MCCKSFNPFVKQAYSHAGSCYKTIVISLVIKAPTTHSDQPGMSECGGDSEVSWDAESDYEPPSATGIDSEDAEAVDSDAAAAHDLCQLADSLRCVVGGEQSRADLARSLRQQYRVTSRNAQKALLKRLDVVHHAAMRKACKVPKVCLLAKRAVGATRGCTMLPSVVLTQGNPVPCIKVNLPFRDWMRSEIKYAVRSDHPCRHKCTGGCGRPQQSCSICLDDGHFVPCVELKRACDAASFLRVHAQRPEVSVLSGERGTGQINVELRKLGPNGVTFDQTRPLLVAIVSVDQVANKTTIEGFLFVSHFVHAHFLATNIAGTLRSAVSLTVHGCAQSVCGDHCGR